MMKPNSGCTYQHFIDAMKILKDSPPIGNLYIYIILRLSNESKEMIVQYSHEINKFAQIKFLKLHILHIVEGSL